jgi:hypothetical protein
MSFVTDCDYCGDVSLCFNDEAGGTCCNYCGEDLDIQEKTEDEEKPACRGEGEMGKDGWFRESRYYK